MDDYKLEKLYSAVVRALRHFVHVSEMKAAAHPLGADGTVAAGRAAGDSSCDKLYFTVMHDVSCRRHVVYILRAEVVCVCSSVGRRISGPRATSC